MSTTPTNNDDQARQLLDSLMEVLLIQSAANTALLRLIASGVDPDALAEAMEHSLQHQRKVEYTWARLGDLLGEVRQPAPRNKDEV